MSLRHSPRLTPAALAARRANARKSTGPRTEPGKARVALNGLKHGRYAVDLAEKLARAHYAESEARWHAIRDRIAQIFGPVLAISLTRDQIPKYRQKAMSKGKPRDRKSGLSGAKYEDRMDQMANSVWCSHRSWQQQLAPKLDSS